MYYILYNRFIIELTFNHYIDLLNGDVLKYTAELVNRFYFNHLFLR